MKAFLKGLKILAIFIALFVGIPALLGYLCVKINWPESLIQSMTEYAHGHGLSTVATYASIGGGLLIILLIGVVCIISIKALGDSW